MTPRSTRLKKKQKYINIEKKLKEIDFTRHAQKSGFKQRKERKIKGKTLFIAFMLMGLQGRNSFQHWAEQMGLLTGKTVSKQGIYKRMTSRLIKFLELALMDALLQQASFTHRRAKQCKMLYNYKRILLQDSTTIGLPSWLRWCFPGNVVRGEKNAQLKIQVVYDLVHNQFIHFEITPFTANDQSKSKDILSIATSGDLVIRDMGYFVLDNFEQMNGQKISFISRLKYAITMYDIQTGKQIDLRKVLRKRGYFDTWVTMGKKQKVNLRLVAIKLSSQQANARRRKARNDKRKRTNHSKEYYEMLGYSLFITSEKEEDISHSQVAQLYGLRWRIETIFKCWKSNFHLQQIIPQHCSLTKERVIATMYMMLLFILLVQVHIYNIAQYAAQRAGKGFISLYKLCRYIANNIDLILQEKLQTWMPHILYYCLYDKRQDRKNFVQNLILS